MIRKRNLLGVVLGSILASLCAHAATTTCTKDVFCGADGARPDRSLALTEQVIQTANGPLGYYRFGQGSPIVLITGYRSTLSEWNAYFLDELAKKHEVIVFDNRGVGLSTICQANYQVKDLAQDTANLIKQLGLHDTTVLGWSMGGMIAQQVAIDGPGLLNHLVVMNSAPPGDHSIPVPEPIEQVLSGVSGSSFDKIMEVLFPAFAFQKAECHFVGDMFTPRSYPATKISQSVADAQMRLTHSWALDNAAFNQLHRVKIRTLILVGARDKVLAPYNGVVLNEAIRNSVLVKVNSGGHAMMYQYPRALAARINAFIGND